MFDSATHPINVGTCAHNIFCFGGQVINHKYPKHKEIEGLEKSNVQRNAIYIYYNKVLHRKNIIGQISIILFYYILEIVTCLVSSVFILRLLPFIRNVIAISIVILLHFYRLLRMFDHLFAVEISHCQVHEIIRQWICVDINSLHL